MNKLVKLCTGFLCFLTGCSGPAPKEYINKTPVLKINKYFDGTVKAWGMLQNRSGKVERRFEVTMKGKWEGNHGTIEEDFVFDDNQKQTRTWNVTIQDDHHFTAKATDSVGEAQGEQYGNVLRMQYTLRVPYKSSTLDVQLDDWMYLLNDRTLLNISKMQKFGFDVGTITITFEKQD